MSEAALTVTKAESVQVPAIVHFPFLELSAILVGGKKPGFVARAIYASPLRPTSKVRETARPTPLCVAMSCASFLLESAGAFVDLFARF